MTLIVGLKCAGCVVIGAETEEAAGITAKRNVYKLLRFTSDDWVVVIGGAGDSAIIDNALRRFERGLAHYAKGLTEEAIGEILDNVLDAVHTKYIDPDPKSEGIALMVGALVGNALHLISTNKRTHQFQDTYAYSGIGADLAIYFLDRLHRQALDWDEAVKLSAFVLKEVKEASQYCGGDSQIYALQCPPNPRWRSLSGEVMMDMENHLNFQNDFLQQILKAIRSFHIAVKADGYEEESDEKK